MAVALPETGSWYGNDGRWWAFTIHVGTPPQMFDVLPSTSNNEFSVPLDEALGCVSLNIPDCGKSRGVLNYIHTPSDGFKMNQSATWKEVDLFEFGPKKLGYDINALLGQDYVSMDLAGKEGGLTASFGSQAVYTWPVPELWLGYFGLDPRPIQLTALGDQKAPLTVLKENGTIPSRSFGYTAGAAYRYTGIPGSLTLGGFDQSRIIADNLTVNMIMDADDPGQGPYMVVLKTIETSTGARLDEGSPITVLIDSTVPELWLPNATCDNFQEAFGLQYDTGSDRYLLNDTAHAQLQELAPNISLTLGNGGNDQTTITLPYSAFDLEASAPIFPNSTKYFPIRRAVNETQYALGRVFLQEAYLLADWEREVFTISQTTFSSPMPDQDIVTITPVNREIASTKSVDFPKRGLSRGVIAGIVIAVIAFTIIVGWVVFWMWKRAKGKKAVIDNGERAELEEQNTYESGSSEIISQFPTRENTAEMEGGKHIFELPSPQEKRVEHVFRS